MPSSTKPEIDKKQIQKAIKALKTFSETNASKNTLISSSVSVYLILGIFKTNEKQTLKPIRIKIPNPIHDIDSVSVCVFVKDPQRDWKEKLANLKFIEKVSGVSKLRLKFKPYEAKRILCESHDLFMADDRVLPLLPKILGKVFFDKKKQPVPVDLTKKDFEAEVKAALNSTYLFFTKGCCTSIKVGVVGLLTIDQIVDNVEAVIESAVGKLGGWENIQCLHLKLAESAALPIFNKMPEFVENEIIEAEIAA